MIFTLLIWIFCFYSWASMVVISESSTFHDKYFYCNSMRFNIAKVYLVQNQEEEYKKMHIRFGNTCPTFIIFYLS